MANPKDPKVVFRNRATYTLIPDIYPVQFTVESMEWNELGGPKSAEITARGGRRGILNLVQLLGTLPEITSPWGYAWWGIVYSVELKFPGLTVTYTLDGMHNRVAVAYTYVGPGAPTGGIRKTSAYAADANSVTDWGTKEFLYTGNNLTDAAALAQRDILLAAGKLPLGAASLLRTGEKISATVNCIGLFDTLDWRMASVPPSLSISYTTLGAAEQAVGSTADNLKVCQQFTVGAANIHAVRVSIYGRISGTPTQDLNIELCALDGSGNPTSNSLVSGSLPPYLFTGSAAWIDLDLGDTILTAATVYGLVTSVGELDAANYYLINVNTALGYSGGAFKIYNSAPNWVTRSPDADMPFRVYVDPQVANTTQVVNLVSTYGEFLRGAVIADAAPDITGSFRDGDTTVLSEVLELLKTGGPNDRKYRAMVNRDRYLVISERPAKGNPYYFLDDQGKILEGTMRANPFDTMLGKWVGMKDFPYTASAVSVKNPDLQYVVGATWTKMDGIQPQFEGIPDAAELLAVYR